MCNYRFNEKSLSYQKCHIAACNGGLLLSGGNCGEDEFLSKEAVIYRIGAEVMIYCVYARLKKLTNRNLWRDFLNFPYFTGFSAHYIVK